MISSLSAKKAFDNSSYNFVSIRIWIRVYLDPMNYNNKIRENEITLNAIEHESKRKDSSALKTVTYSDCQTKITKWRIDLFVTTEVVKDT